MTIDVRDRLGRAFVLLALAGAALSSLRTISSSPRPAPGPESDAVLSVTGLLHPSSPDVALALGRALPQALLYWPASQLTDTAGLALTMRALSGAAFLAAIVFVALTAKVLAGWLAGGLAACVLAAASGLHAILDRSPFAALGLALCSALLYAATADRGDRRLCTAILIATVLAALQPFLVPVAVVGVVVAARRLDANPSLALVPMGAAVVALVGASLLDLDPFGRGSAPPGTGFWTLMSIAGSLQGEVREAVELAWDYHGLAVVAFLGLLGVGLSAVRPNDEKRARMLGAGIFLAGIAYAVTVIPAYLVIALARGGDIPLTLFAGLQLGIALVCGISIASIARSDLGASAVALAAVGMLALPLFDVRVLG